MSNLKSASNDLQFYVQLVGVLLGLGHLIRYKIFNLKQNTKETQRPSIQSDIEHLILGFLQIILYLQEP